MKRNHQPLLIDTGKLRQSLDGATLEEVGCFTALLTHCWRDGAPRLVGLSELKDIAKTKESKRLVPIVCSRYFDIFDVDNVRGLFPCSWESFTAPACWPKWTYDKVFALDETGE